MFHFSKLKRYFIEFFYLNLVRYKVNGRHSNSRLSYNCKSVQIRQVYFSLVYATALFQELLEMQQQIFFLSSATDYVSHRLDLYRCSQVYADRSARLWGITNQALLTEKKISKGREADFSSMDGVVVNFSKNFLRYLPFRYFFRSDNILISIGLSSKIDFPLLFPGNTNKNEGFLLDYFTRLTEQLSTVNTYAHFTMLLGSLLANKRGIRADFFGRSSAYLQREQNTRMRISRSCSLRENHDAKIVLKVPAVLTGTLYRQNAFNRFTLSQIARFRSAPKVLKKYRELSSKPFLKIKKARRSRTQ